MTDQTPPAGACDLCYRPHFRTHTNPNGTEHRLCGHHWNQLRGGGRAAPRAYQRAEDGGTETQRGEPMEYRRGGLL